MLSPGGEKSIFVLLARKNGLITNSSLKAHFPHRPFSQTIALHSKHLFRRFATIFSRYFFTIEQLLSCHYIWCSIWLVIVFDFNFNSILIKMSFVLVFNYIAWNGFRGWYVVFRSKREIWFLNLANFGYSH